MSNFLLYSVVTTCGWRISSSAVSDQRDPERVFGDHGKPAPDTRIADTSLHPSTQPLASSPDVTTPRKIAVPKRGGYRWFIAAAAVLLVGLGAFEALSPTRPRHPPPPPRVPSGFTLVRSADDGYALAIPESYQRSVVERANRDKVREELIAPEAADWFTQWTDWVFGFHGKVVLFADEYGDIISLVRLPDPLGDPSDALARAQESKLRKNGFTDVASSKIVIGGRGALKVTYTSPATEEEESIQVTDVYIGSEDATFLLSISTYEMTQAEVETVIASLRLEIR